MNEVLFLDFDGVLFNTIKEVYLINRFLFSFEDFFARIDEDNFYFFKKHKYLVYNIWMFYYFNPLSFNNDKEIEQKFTQALLNRDFDKEKVFVESFLKTRYYLIKNHPDFWRNLEVPYGFFYEIKQIYQKKTANVVIVSKKNKASILERLQTYGLDFDPDKVFGYEILDKYLSKGDFLEEYLYKNRIERAVFVDDNLNNINSVKNENIKKILALWGNTGPNEKGCSESEAIYEIRKFFSL